MIWPYFIWKNRNSKDFGIVINDYPPIIRPKVKTTALNVPGRGGSLTKEEGEDIFEPIVKIVTCTLLKPENINRVFDWLRGSGEVIFGNEPEYKYYARMDEQISLEKMYRYDTRRQFDVPFVCQPGKALVKEEEAITITQSGTRITNPGNMIALPKMEVTWASGKESTLIIGGSATAFKGIGTGAFVDCEIKECFNKDKSQLINHVMVGEFLKIYPGEWSVSWTGGITKILLTPNWRYL
ncbi:MAG: hypothetical protein GX786_03045 [Clostridiales bacterium]|nr:hypothetical protein [Clostridiales bacterium]